jgi:hypothetical protein
MEWLMERLLNTAAQIPAQWIPVIALLVAALLGVVGYVWQKSPEIPQEAPKRHSVAGNT